MSLAESPHERPRGGPGPNRGGWMTSVPRVGLLSAIAALCLVSAPPSGWGADDEAAGALVEAQEAYRRNVALGESLGGRPASAEQAAEAKRLFDDGLSKARECISRDARSAEAHRVAGILLCMAYGPVSIPADQLTGSSPAGPNPQTVTVLRRGAAGDCEEGLAELRTALRLEKSRLDYYLDHAEALYVCGDLAGCQQQALSVWDQRALMANVQCARCACMLADCAGNRSDPDAQMRWLREAVKHDPQHEGAQERLAELVAAQPSIVWLEYEEGKALAAGQKKPMLMQFSTSRCGWCKKLDKEILSDPHVVSFCRQLVCIKVDGDQRRDLVSAFGVRGYPTTIVLDHQGRRLHGIVGYRPTSAYLAELRRALSSQ